MKVITSVNNSYIKELSELKKNNVKKEKGLFLVEGNDFIELAYQEKLVEKLLVLSYDKRYIDVEQIIVNDAVLNKLSNNKSCSGMIGLCRYKKPKNIERDCKLLYLDGVQDPGNVGTLIRTSLAFGYDGVILSDDSASMYNDKVISSTKGALFKMNIYSDVSIDLLKEMNYKIVSTSLGDSIDYRLFVEKSNFVLVLGNEGQGVKKYILEKSDVIVRIPMSNIDSLNVAIAGGILMNEYR